MQVSGQRPGPGQGPANRLSPRLRRSPGGAPTACQPSREDHWRHRSGSRIACRSVGGRGVSLHVGTGSRGGLVALESAAAIRAWWPAVRPLQPCRDRDQLADDRCWYRSTAVHSASLPGSPGSAAVACSYSQPGGEVSPRSSSIRARSAAPAAAAPLSRRLMRSSMCWLLLAPAGFPVCAAALLRSAACSYSRTAFCQARCSSWACVIAAITSGDATRGPSKSRACNSRSDSVYRFKTHRRVSDLRIPEISYAAR